MRFQETAMPKTMIVKLTNNNQTQPESAVLKQNNDWTSAPGGWLPVQAGIWEDPGDGVHLHGPAHRDHHAHLQGLKFDLNKKGDMGTALYPTLGDTGGWSVVDVVVT